MSFLFFTQQQFQVWSTYSPLTKDRSRWQWQWSHLPSFIQLHRGLARKREIEANNSIQQGSGWKSHISVFTGDLWIKCMFFFFRILHFQTWTSTILHQYEARSNVRFILTCIKKLYTLCWRLMFMPRLSPLKSIHKNQVVGALKRITAWNDVIRLQDYCTASSRHKLALW